jgi:membrane glycosyltransferase
LVETGQKHLAAQGGAGTWKHVQPPDSLYLEGDYESQHIAELHQKLDDAMVSLAEAYKQREGAKRHKQVMIQMATPKHRPKRRQKQLRKAADARIEAATREGDATIAKMQENVLKWKGTAVHFPLFPSRWLVRPKLSALCP